MTDPGDPVRLRSGSHTAPELVSALESAREELPDAGQVRLVARHFPELQTATLRPASRSFRKAPRAWQVAVLVLALASIAVAASMLRSQRANLPASPVGASNTSKTQLVSARPADRTPSQVEVRTATNAESGPPASNLDAGGAASSSAPKHAVAVAPTSMPDRSSKRALAVSPDPSERRRDSDEQSSTEGAARAMSDAEASPAPASAEAILLSRAQRALASDPKLALKLSEQHRHDYPRGKLSQEREMIAIQALLALGRSAQGTARAERFRAAHPSSVHRRRLDSLLPPGGGAR
ncbi:MAG TPA: hypothetical protein VK524_22400 [Polyangiaceae bacterium]|nr:hypothetical protein [Polyangiaceae bacterium]